MKSSPSKAKRGRPTQSRKFPAGTCLESGIVSSAAELPKETATFRVLIFPQADGKFAYKKITK